MPLLATTVESVAVAAAAAVVVVVVEVIQLATVVVVVVEVIPLPTVVEVVVEVVVVVVKVLATTRGGCTTLDNDADNGGSTSTWRDSNIPARISVWAASL
jgi:hypothetical protein